MVDLNMTTQQFASAISILFVGYLPFQIPSNLFISRISRPGLYICVCACIWGAISASTAAVKTYSQLMAVRAILGIAEVSLSLDNAPQATALTCSAHSPLGLLLSWSMWCSLELVYNGPC